MITHVVNSDIGADCSLRDFLEMLESFEATLLAHVAVGPGGGNPNVSLGFKSFDKAFDFVVEMHGSSNGEDSDDHHNWMNDQVIHLVR